MKEATALYDAGCSITIICGNYIPGAAEVDSQIAHPDWTVRRVSFGRKMAHPAVHARQRAGQAFARLIFRSGAGAAEIGYLAHAPVAGDLVSAACAIPADLYIAHYVAALPAAAKAAERHGARYAFDAEDFHLGDLPDKREHALEKRIIRAIEGRYLPGAAYVTAASPMIAEAYAEAYGIPLPTTVLNVFPKRNAPASPTPRGTVEPGPSLYWFSQTIGPGRGLETAIEAITRAESRPHLYLRGTPTRGYADNLRRLAAKVGTADRLHLLNPAAPDELERLGANYDLGYSGETGFSPNNTKALGNKLFSYLLSGVPSLASDIPAHRRAAADFGPAMNLFPISDATALATAIDTLLLDPSRLAAARAHAWRLGQDRYNWEMEAPLLLERIQTVLRGRGRSA